MIVRLTAGELAVAAFVAELRTKHVKRAGAKNRLAGRKTSPEEEAGGVGAELAAAKHLNLYPTGLGGRDAPADVGLHYQVRSTRHELGHLIAHPEDPLDHRFLLVIVAGDGAFDIRGTVFGRRAARRPAKVDDYGHAGYWVPQSELDPPHAKGAA